MDYSKLLNNDQLNAVSATSQYIRVIAGAGSGKTRVLTYRIAYLIDEFNVDPNQILAIAFTNKVANEMKNRIASLLPNVSNFLHISTFHSFCARFLRNEIQNLNFSTSFTIFDDDDSEKLIKDICVARGHAKNDDIVKISMRYIANKKCRGEYPENVKLGMAVLEGECLEIYKEYEERKSQMIALDFDDLLLKTNIILENFPEVRNKWRARIRHLLVDEFQDTNDVQFKLLKLLSDSSTSVYVVGDPDQTIYTWRGANQSIILDFEKTFRGAQTIILDQNYRSTKTILDAANKLIKYNKKRVPKNLYTNNIYGDKITVFNGITKEVEAQHVITTIKRMLDKNEVFSLKQIAILYRSAYLTLPFEKELVKNQIKYRVFGGMRFYQRKEIKDALAYFRLIMNSKDDVSFERIINVPKRKIGDRSIEILKSESRTLHIPMLEYVAKIENYDTELSNKVAATLSLLAETINKTKEKLLENDEIYAKVLEDFLIEIGYYQYLDLDDNAEERKENLKTLFDDMISFIKKNPSEGFDKWLENATLATSQDEMDDDNYVSLMTVHTAKGLEFDYVFVVGLAQSVFPNQRALDESRDGIEEERRLCYVAFTRAKKKLMLSMNSGFSYVIESNPQASQFLKEAGLEVKSEPTFGRKENYPRVKKSFFDDIRNNDFESDVPVEPIKEEPAPQPENNGITDWVIGDKLTHEKFGVGVVKKVLVGNIIIVEFDKYGEKTLLGTHIKIKRIEKDIGELD